MRRAKTTWVYVLTESGHEFTLVKGVYATAQLARDQVPESNLECWERGHKPHTWVMCLDAMTPGGAISYDVERHALVKGSREEG